MKWNQIKKLPDLMSPVNWLIIIVYIGVTFFLILKPTIKEFIMLLVVDYISLGLMKAFFERIYVRLYPDAKPYLNGITADDIKAMDHPSRLKLIESIGTFPVRRAYYVYFFSLIKVLPAVFLMTVIWEHQTSNFVQFLLICGITLINFTYFSGVVFFEANIFLSNLLRDMHQQIDLKDVFKAVKVKGTGQALQKIEYTIFAFFFVYMIGLHMVLLLGDMAYSRNELALMMAIVSLMTLILSSRIWFMSRSYIFSNITTLFQDIQSVGVNGNYPTLALNTSSAVSQFQQAVNSLILRLQSNEKELEQLIAHEAERGKFFAVGEISALVAHDLSGPLHAALFCANEIKENPKTDKFTNYMNKVTTNLERAWDLVRSLRARLRNSDEEGGTTTFQTACEHVMRLLKVQFLANDFDTITFDVDSRLNNLTVGMSSTDFIHILDNLYRNGIHELLRSKPEQPKIQVSMYNVTERNITIHIQDNGRGLSKEKFESITGELSREGLGLRLIRRLVEHNKGRLDVLDLPNGNGTLFELIVPRVRET